MGVMSDIMCLLLEIVTVTVQKKFQKEKALAPSIEKKKKSSFVPHGFELSTMRDFFPHPGRQKARSPVSSSSVRAVLIWSSLSLGHVFYVLEVRVYILFFV